MTRDVFSDGRRLVLNVQMSSERSENFAILERFGSLGNWRSSGDSRSLHDLRSGRHRLARDPIPLRSSGEEGERGTGTASWARILGCRRLWTR